MQIVPKKIPYFCTIFDSNGSRTIQVETDVEITSRWKLMTASSFLMFTVCLVGMFCKILVPSIQQWFVGAILFGAGTMMSAVAIYVLFSVKNQIRLNELISQRLDKKIYISNSSGHHVADANSCFIRLHPAQAIAMPPAIIYATVHAWCLTLYHPDAVLILACSESLEEIERFSSELVEIIALPFDLAQDSKAEKCWALI